MNRRIRKAEQIMDELSRDADLREELEIVRDMVDKTDTYPVRDGFVDLEKLDDVEYNEILDAHESLEKAYDQWTEVKEKYDRE